MRTGPRQIDVSRTINGKAVPFNHRMMKGGDPSDWGGTPGPVENPAVTLDPQNRFGADNFYKQSIKRQDLLFPWARFPWMTIAGPQLLQAPSIHNIWNMHPPVYVKILPSPQINQSRSNRLRSIISNRIKLPNTGIFSTGGVS